MVHELLPLEILLLLLESPSDDSVEVAVDFVKEVRVNPRLARGAPVWQSGAAVGRIPILAVCGPCMALRVRHGWVDPRLPCPPLVPLQVGPLLMDLAPSGLTTIMDRLRWGPPLIIRLLGGVHAPSPACLRLRRWASTCWVAGRRGSRLPLLVPGAALHSPLPCPSALPLTEAAGCRSSLPQPCAAQLCTAHYPALPPAHPTPARRTIISEGNVDVRTQYLVEGLFSLRKAGFEG